VRRGSMAVMLLALAAAPARARGPECAEYQSAADAAWRARVAITLDANGTELPSLHTGAELQTLGEGASRIWAVYLCSGFASDPCVRRTAPSLLLGWILGSADVPSGMTTTDVAVGLGVVPRAVFLLPAVEGERRLAGALKAERRALDDATECRQWGSAEVQAVRDLKAMRGPR
jgi:hypothetical protein